MRTNGTIRLTNRQREVGAGLIVGAIGIATIALGRSYRVGSLTDMGPGFFPLALGVALILIGTVIVWTRNRAGGEGAPIVAISSLDLRGISCVVFGMLAFIFLGDMLGFIPAAFASVFISALGDRSTSLKAAFLLSSCVTLFGVLLFYYFLQVPLPLFQWGS